ncbi:MAG: sugar phosphate nucleotidyltransferase [Halobacteriaceae archaeon]
MKAVVLAGGYATRLWPITKNRPKMFLPIGDTVMIDHVFDALEDDDRISEVYVSTNERFADDFREHLAERPYEKPTLTVEETTAEDEKLGVVGALAQLVEREGVEEDTLVIAGDNVISFAISDFLDFFEAQGTPALAAYDVGSPEKTTAYSVVELDGDRVVDFEEKPDDPQSSLISIACYAFTADTLPMLSEYLAGGNNPDEPGWFMQWLQNRETVHAYSFDGAWFDIGTPQSYLDAVAWELDGEALVDDDATLDNTTVGDNVHVMDGAELRNSSVDHSVVFPEATVRDCDVRDSIVDEDTHLENIDFSGAVVGAHTHIDGS